METSDQLPADVTHHDSSKMTPETTNTPPKKANFEEAVAATGYGKFHYLLYLAIIPASWASGFDTTAVSMILPSAECDLNLNLYQKGVLNAIVYAGMVSSALLWGFVADSFGRKPIVFYGYLLDSILNIMSGFSSNFLVLAFFKFITGFVVSGPYASVLTYCAEFHCTKERPRVTMLIGFFLTMGSIASPAIGLAIIPQNWSFAIMNYEVHAWQIYLMICGLPVLFGSLCIGFFPESPKFLMSQGRNQEALEVFQTIYAINTGKSSHSYPIKELADEVTTTSDSNNRVSVQNKDLKASIHDGLLQMKPLFLGSYFLRLLLVLTIQFGGMLSTNTLRLWQPQLFAIMAESNQNNQTNRTDVAFCQIIDQSILSHIQDNVSNIALNVTESPTCIRKIVENSVYTNTMIISSASLFFTFLAGTLVSVKRNKYLLLICYFVATCSTISLIWSKNAILTLFFMSLFVGCLSATVQLCSSVTVTLFPTTMRTMAVSLTMMTGRIGSLIGNILFPVFLQYGCIVALLSISSLVAVAFILTLFIPKPRGVVN
ncbi:synaptic vesicle glycoprotein 2B-like [Phymastichus coffea]|uniref:synaptic vesicle glycoprotein 2B-like n=1 Tax=Phymastichus coffea TaxID=108790 RepID=UPI00273AD1BE|nr:synaptic vesicle glycoprotein 2B-like [Phymastichus coffea]